MQKPKVGISSCLLGQSVRYDGGHCHSSICTDTLQTHFQYIPFCPEVAAGFGTPRAPMNLVVNLSTPQLEYAENIEDYSGKAGVDLSGKLADGFLTKLDQAAELNSYITKSRSPSCGRGTTPLYTASTGLISETGSGLFISALVERYPQLPIVDETELEDRVILERFIADVTAYNSLRNKSNP
ncbi:MAG: DUF523 domain-containing protein [Pseudomonadales bacterium]|nr:DUF523 domain-containing protein [Pseudomonadales bacterium]